MGTFVLQRLAQGMILCVLTSLLVFFAVYALGNPVTMLINPASPPDVITDTIQRLGLDQPLHVQYWRFVKGALQGDLGVSYISSRSALLVIFERLPATLELALTAILIALLIGIPLGLVSGYWPDKISGRVINAVSILGISLPTFWIGLTLITVFAIGQGWFPTGGRGPVGTVLGASSSLFTLQGLRHLVLPALNLSFFPLAMMIRLTRAGVRETISAPHIRFAKAKGLSPARILFRYILPSIAIPIITVIGILFGVLLAYGIVTETVFAWPGIGKLIIDSIKNSDRPVIVAYIMFTVTLFVFINLAVDLICAVIDPRISLEEAR